MFVDPIALKALQNMLAEIETMISTASASPDDRTARCLELIQAARAITNDMVKRGNRIH